jgi:hypothetical protein
MLCGTLLPTNALPPTCSSGTPDTPLTSSTGVAHSHVGQKKRPYAKARKDSGDLPLHGSVEK